MIKRAIRVSDYHCKNAGGIANIVKDGLCHRCGACVGLCPSAVLELDAHGFPIIRGDCLACNTCNTICSGAVVDYPALGSWVFGKAYRFDKTLGIVRAAYVGHAADPKIRWAGSSGGVVTQLLIYLLESGQVDGALVTITDPEDPSFGKGVIAKNSIDISRAAQSRYTTAPTLSALREIEAKNGKYAVVALPCQVHAIRKLQMTSDEWNDRISLVIGLMCHYRLPHEATAELAAILGPQGGHLSDIKYRKKDKKGWPHNTVQMRFSDGSKWRSPYPPLQTVGLLGQCYPRGRCATCLDASAEFSDISVGDPWIRNIQGDWKYSSPGGWTSIIVRTQSGEKAISSGAAHGKLVLKPIHSKEIQHGQFFVFREKKEDIPFRILVRKFFHMPVPQYAVTFPKPNIRTIIIELNFMILRVISAFRPIRILFVKLGFSKAGSILMALRAQRNMKRDVAWLKKHT